MQERKAVTKALAEQYRGAGKKDKGRILDRFVEGTGYNRSYATWLLRNHGRRVEVKPGVRVEGDAGKRPSKPRAKRYGPDVLQALITVWKCLDCINGKRLAAALPDAVANLVAHRELKASASVRRKLMEISPATIDRLLGEERKRYILKSRARTKPGTLLKHQIPIRTFSDWDNTRPGFVEMDLVAHDGGVVIGEYCQTLDITDVATGWSEACAVPSKAQSHVFAALLELRRRLPVGLLGVHSDNGGEFINDQLRRYCVAHDLTFTRGRPYRKNDTCHVEEKNWSVVRRNVGYARFDTEAAHAALNALYRDLRDYVNFFLPCMKLKEKIRDGARVTRRYDTPRTPYQRMLDSAQVPESVKRQLRRRRAQFNLAELKRHIERWQRRLDQLATRPTAHQLQTLADKAAKTPAPHHPWRRAGIARSA